MSNPLAPDPIASATPAARAGEASPEGRAKGLALTSLDDLIGTVSDLEPADLVRYLEDGPGAMPEVQRVTTRHHRMAQRLAQGERPTVVARMFSCTPATITRLQASPAFMALVEHYQTVMLDRDQMVMDKMSDLHEEALDKLAERMDKDLIDTKTLVQLQGDLANRTGFPEKKEVKVQQGGLPASEIEEMKRRARASEGSVVLDVDAEVVDV